MSRIQIVSDAKFYDDLKYNNEQTRLQKDLEGFVVSVTGNILMSIYSDAGYEDLFIKEYIGEFNDLESAIGSSLPTKNKPYTKSDLLEVYSEEKFKIQYDNEGKISIYSLKVDEEKYISLIIEKLLPGLLFVNQTAEEQNCKVFVKLPSIGCGAFAGKLTIEASNLFEKSVESLLNQYGTLLTCISYISYGNEKKQINGINLIRDDWGMPFSSLQSLSKASEKVLIVNFMPWCSTAAIPKFDSFCSRVYGHFATIFGTSALESMTGIKGQYNEQEKFFETIGYKSWHAALKQSHKIDVNDKNIYITDPNAKMYTLGEYLEKIMKKEIESQQGFVGFLNQQQQQVKHSQQI